MNTSPETARYYLQDYLQEEFRRFPEVRVRILPHIVENSEEDGVTVKTESREYFFPTLWLMDRRLDLVQEQCRRIKSVLPERE